MTRPNYGPYEEAHHYAADVKELYRAQVLSLISYETGLPISKIRGECYLVGDSLRFRGSHSLYKLVCRLVCQKAAEQAQEPDADLYALDPSAILIRAKYSLREARKFVERVKPENPTEELMKLAEAHLRHVYNEED